MALQIDTILSAVESHALTTGVFERVNRHEPKNAPGSGLTAAIWVDAVDPYSGGSGLAATSGRITLKIRIYQNFKSEPQDAIDPTVTAAVDLLLANYSGDFELGGNVRNVDLLGAGGTPLSARAGYLNQDGTLFRIMDITLPLIINDIWGQSP